MAVQKRHVELKLRLYPGQHDDIIDWLKQRDSQYGSKSRDVIDALRRGIGTLAEPTAIPATTATDLAEIRQVVEAAIDSALARLEGQISKSATNPPAEDAEMEDMLDQLGASLVLAEE